MIQITLSNYFRNHPARVYLLKVKNRNTRTRYEIYSQLTIKFWYLYC